MGSASQNLGKTLPPTAAVAPLPHWPIPPRLLLSAVESRPASRRPLISVAIRFSAYSAARSCQRHNGHGLSGQGACQFASDEWTIGSDARTLVRPTGPDADEWA